ncbi:hypothetical protein ACFX1X_000313 [Malus domestica]
MALSPLEVDATRIEYYATVGEPLCELNFVLSGLGFYDVSVGSGVEVPRGELINMIVRYSCVGIPMCLKGVLVLFYPKIHVSPCDYFLLHKCPHTCWAARKKGQQQSSTSCPCKGLSFVDFFIFSVPHRCKKKLIFIAFFLDSAIAGQPSGWCGTSAGRGQELCGRDHCLGNLAWLEPRAACAAGVADCGIGAQC